MAGARANRQGGELPRAGKGSADGQQYCLQRDRIGRRNRYERPHMVPPHLVPHIHRRESKAVRGLLEPTRLHQE
jgi:hypothetical protein